MEVKNFRVYKGKLSIFLTELDHIKRDSQDYCLKVYIYVALLFHYLFIEFLSYY